MVHTYGERWPENALLRALARIAETLFAGFFAVAMIFAVAAAFAGLPFVQALLLSAGIAFFLYLTGHRLSTYCKEIRLRDDGLCEFETRRGIVRAHVAQITSVQESIDEDGDANYEVRFRDRGKLWTSELSEFEDFLRRVEAMNPAIAIKRDKSRRRR
jgi:hypothetical protein